jgi:hypothetical protein
MPPHQRVLHHENTIRPGPYHVGERGVETGRRVNGCGVNGKPERACCCFGGAHLRGGRGVSRVPEDRDAPKLRNNLAKQFQPFATEIRQHHRGAGHIAAGMRQTAHKPGFDGVPHEQHDDRDRRGRGLGSDRLGGSGCRDHIDLQPGEFGREFWNPFRFVVGVPVFDDEVLALDVSEFAETVDEAIHRRLRM